MRYNLIASNAFAKSIKVTSNSGLWDVKFTWYSLSVIPQIYFYGLENSLGIFAFRLTWSLMFLQPEQDFLNNLVTVLGSTAPLPFAPQIILVASMAYGTVQTHKAFPKLDCIVHSYVHISNHTEWSNAHVSSPTTTIQPNTVFSFHSLNCFGQGIYGL